MKTKTIKLWVMSLFLLLTLIGFSRDERNNAVVHGPNQKCYNCVERFELGGINFFRSCGCCCWQFFVTNPSGFSKCCVDVDPSDPPSGD